jgi:hypothetical protein
MDDRNCGFCQPCAEGRFDECQSVLPTEHTDPDKWRGDPEFYPKRVAELEARLSESEQREREAVAYAERLKDGLLDAIERLEAEDFTVLPKRLRAIIAKGLPQALPSLRQQHMEEAANAAENYSHGACDSREGIAAAIRRLAEQEKQG